MKPSPKQPNHSSRKVFTTRKRLQLLKLKNYYLNSTSVIHRSISISKSVKKRKAE